MSKLISRFILTLVATLPLSASANQPEVRELSFYHTHTGETLQIVYFSDGNYVSSALTSINRFLRDFRTEDERIIDPALLDILHTIYTRTGSSGHFEIISAYRSPKTNEMLRGKSNGVASKSQHLLGKAIDVRLTDIPTSELRAAAVELGLGGVGHYVKSNFVHIDTGRVRTW